MQRKVHVDGRVVVPKSLRDELGWVAGTQLEVDVVEGKLVVSQVTSASPYTGLLSGERATDS